MTKAKFIEAYREALLSEYDWAHDAAKLEKFLGGVSRTINEQGMEWNKDGSCVLAAWRKIGGKGKPTYKELRALS